MQRARTGRRRRWSGLLRRKRAENELNSGFNPEDIRLSRMVQYGRIRADEGSHGRMAGVASLPSAAGNWSDLAAAVSLGGVEPGAGAEFSD